jgi:hypothetical protein
MFDCSVCCDLFSKDQLKIFTCLHLVCEKCHQETLICLSCYQGDLLDLSSDIDKTDDLPSLIADLNYLIERSDDLRDRLREKFKDLLQEAPSKSEEITAIMILLTFTVIYHHFG